MRIIDGRWPPNIAAIDKAFPLAKKKIGIIFAWGDAIFNPWSVEISIPLRMHEGVHMERQGADPELWWLQYIASAEFRLAEELPAHAAEYGELIADLPNRNHRRRALAIVAAKLAAPLYGGLVSVNQAKFFIKKLQEVAD